MVLSGDYVFEELNKVDLSIFSLEDLGVFVGDSTKGKMTFEDAIKGIGANLPLNNYLDIMRLARWNMDFSRKYFDSFGDEKYDMEIKVGKRVAGVVRDAFFRELERRIN